MENSFYIAACLGPHSLSASLQVLEVAREMRDDPMVVRVAGGIYGTCKTWERIGRVTRVIWCL
jgi:enoyl reductase-like protein